MFTELVESTAVRKQTKKSWTVIVSAALQILFLLVLILIPLIYTQALPIAMPRSLLLAPVVPLAPPPPVTPQPATPIRRVTRFVREGVLREPARIPRHAQIAVEAPVPPEMPAAGLGAGFVPDGLPFAGGPGSSLALPAPPVPPPVKTITRARVGGAVEAAKLIAQLQPVYPVLATQARIQGDVQLRAIISADGSVTELQVISGNPLLVRAALEAVRQWRYQPTLLNGQPVEVETMITVSFVLGK